MNESRLKNLDIAARIFGTISEKDKEKILIMKKYNFFDKYLDAIEELTSLIQSRFE